MTYTIHRIRTAFTRVGYEVKLFESDGKPSNRIVDVFDEYGRRIGRAITSYPMRFYGDDGRKVRAEAIACAKAYCKA